MFIRTRLMAAAAAIAVLAAACNKDAEPPKAAKEAPTAVVNRPEPSLTDQPAFPAPELDVPDRVSRLMSTPITEEPVGKSSKQRLDASSPAAFVASLQVIARESSKENVDNLRAALTVMQMQTQTRISQIASSSPTPPQFTDEQLMKIAFAEIDGMTLDQVVAHAKKVAPTVLPQK